MKRFRFRLERFLDLAKYEERQWELRLAEITGVCVALANEIGSLKGRKAAAFASRRGLRDAGDLISLELFMKNLEQRAERLEVSLREKEKVRDEVRKGYLEASRKRKVLDKLREKKEAEYYKDQNRAEVGVIDDINSGNAARMSAAASEG